MFLRFSCVIKFIVYTVQSFIINVRFNVLHFYWFFDTISFLVEYPCGKELQYYGYAFVSFDFYFSFWNVVYFDSSIVFINLRGYNTYEVVVLFLCLCKIFLCHYFVSVSIVMGIPTVKREVKSYLIETLHSLIDNLYPEEKLDCVIVVFIGEVII